MKESASFERPPLHLLVTEAPRAIFESILSSLLLGILARAPRGDGHAVLVLPGFLASDRSTQVLRDRLGHLGYRPEPWTLGNNVGPTDAVLDGLLKRLRALADIHGSVSLIGWSMGGAYARWLASESPEYVRQVITLASPLRHIPSDSTSVGVVFDHLKHSYSARSRGQNGLLSHEPLSVASTAIYSRDDGVLPWRACTNTQAQNAESVRVRGSHAGMGANVSALYVIADRLGQPQHSWQPFVPPPTLAGWYPPHPDETVL
jgi:pimeloyl-ACP methyl ester carboxylesterase